MNRKDHWESIYRNKSPLDVSWYQKEPALSLSLINSLRLKKDENIIDVGGGASTLVDRLLDEGFENVSVLDLSANALDHAAHRLGHRAKSVTWMNEDITNLVPDRSYSLWHDRAVFHFLTEKSDRQKYRKALEAAVRPDGHAIIAAFAIGGPKKCSGLDIVQYDGGKLQKELGERFALIEERSETHITPQGRKQLFGFFLFRRAA